MLREEHAASKFRSRVAAVSVTVKTRNELHH
jgi:hypothetical protein